jgi:hypothetical protein
MRDPPFAEQIEDRDKCHQISVAHGGHVLASKPRNQVEEDWRHCFTLLSCSGHGGLWENVVPR